MSDVSLAHHNRRIDRRREPKRSTKVTCRKGALDLGPNVALGILDVSETGVRLRLCEAVPAHQEVAVTLEGPNHMRPLRRVGRVIWCISTIDGAYCSGVHFDKRLPYVDFVKLT